MRLPNDVQTRFARGQVASRNQSDSGDEDRVFLSVITFAEIRLGVEVMVAGWRRDGLTRWLQVELPARFEGHILGVDLVVAEGWGDLMARGSKIGLNLSVMDAFFLLRSGLMGSRWLPGIPSTSKDWALV